jgi:hypothetical protein
MSDPSALAVVHGAAVLGAVVVDAYNAELQDAGRLIGDRATIGAFRAVIEESREQVRQIADDPLGDTPTADLSKTKLDKVLAKGDPEAAGVIHGAVEDFSVDLTAVVTRLLKSKGWGRTQRIVVGGGLRASRVGELIIGRVSVLLKRAGHSVDLVPIHQHPDEAGLMGAVYLVPAWMLAGHDGIVAVDVGGSNLRAGIVELRPKKQPDLSKCVVREFELWRYADEIKKPTRDRVVERVSDMIGRLVRWAEKHQLVLAPFVGVACPGIIAADGQIERGGQNLPGNWESSRFNLPSQIAESASKIWKQQVTVVMHNDAVVQGLSELPFVQDVEEWAVLTIGTGLGNAKFTNHPR